MNTLWSLLGTASLVASIVATAHLLLRYRDPTAAVGWLFAVWALPVVGTVAYAAFAVYPGRRVVRVRRELSKRLRNLERREHGAAAARVDDELTRQNEFARRAGALPATIGNQVLVHENGASARRDVIELLRGAEREVLLETYIWEDDALTREIVEILSEKVALGVAVRVLVDAVGSYRMFGDRLGALRERGIPCAEFLAPNPLKGRFQFNSRNHRKLLVVDREVAFLGGRNFSEEYFDDGPNGIRDLSVRVEGPAVGPLLGVFLEDWVVATDGDAAECLGIEGPEPQGSTTVRVVPHGSDEARDAFVPLLSSALRTSREEIVVVTPYFVPSPSIRHDLRIAALSGVRVRVLIPERSPERWPELGARRFFEEFFDAGVEIYTRPAPFIHAKAVVVDGSRTFVGSANFDNRSFLLNYELTLEIPGTEFARSVLAYFEPDFAVATRIDPDAFLARPWWNRAVENAVALFSPVL
ncbi:MAG: phospholipase D-like domain-containing protein [Planctomycetota bacterium]